MDLNYCFFCFASVSTQFDCSLEKGHHDRNNSCLVSLNAYFIHMTLFFCNIFNNITLPRECHIHIISHRRHQEPKKNLVRKLDHQGPLFSIFCHQTKPKICSFLSLRHKVSYATREFLPHFSPRALMSFNGPSAYRPRDR